MFKGTMTKWPVQKLTQGTTQNSYNIMTQQTFRKTLNTFVVAHHNVIYKV